MDKLTEQLIRHEGLRLKPYKCTAGKTTIGVGRNLDDRGITAEEATMLLENDIEVSKKDLISLFPIVASVSQPRREALINMCFNLGINRLSRFRKMWAAIANDDWDSASKEALDSMWARQVGRRATELAEQLRTGSYQ